MLPQGWQIPHHSYFQIRDSESGDKVGILWVFYDPEERRKMAFIYDLRVDKPFRRHGYASQSLLALEGDPRSLGAQKRSACTFSASTPALRLSTSS